MDREMALRLVEMCRTTYREWEAANKNVSPFSMNLTEEMIRVMIRVETMEAVVFEQNEWHRTMAEYDRIPHRLIEIRIVAYRFIDPEVNTLAMSWHRHIDLQ